MNKTIKFSNTGKSPVTREVSRRFRFNVEYTICAGKNVIFDKDSISLYPRQSQAVDEHICATVTGRN